MDPTMIAIVTTIITAILGIGGTWWLTKTDQATKLKLVEDSLDKAKKERNEIEAARQKLAAECQNAKAENERLVRFREKYHSVKAALESSIVVQYYHQPVILAGPVKAGKTSLLLQWHTPWIASDALRTRNHLIAEVPIYDFVEADTQPHFADPDIPTRVNAHLVLRVHDFPGELKSQKLIRQKVEEETEYLRTQLRKSLGVVLICLFDAEEAFKGVSDKTTEYYNGELFHEMRQLVAHHNVALDRLILVFNKYDLLKEHYQNLSDDDLLDRCTDRFATLLSPLKGACNPEKVCEVFTVLPANDMHRRNRGAPVVLGEAARTFVETVAGKHVAAEVLTQSRASNRSADKFT